MLTSILALLVLAVVGFLGFGRRFLLLRVRESCP